MIYKQKVDKIN